MARTETKISNMTGLWRVRYGKVLLWPERWMDPINHPLNTRGKAGYVVDCDEPHEKLLVWGQEKKLEPVPKAEYEAARKRIQNATSFPRPIYSELRARGMVEPSTPSRRTKDAAMAVSAAKASVPSPESIPDITPAAGESRPARGRSKPTNLIDGMEDDKGSAGA